MKKIIYFFSLVVLLGSCQLIMKTIYGIKKPRVETKMSIQRKAHHFGLDTTNLVSIAADQYLSVIAGKGIPDAAIYDAKGKYIEYRQTDTSCNAGLFDFIPNLRKDMDYAQPDTISLTEMLTRFRDLDGNPLKPLDPADFYILIYWNVWTGKLNKNHVKVWEQLAKENTNCHIRVLKVNADVQSYWDPADQERIMKLFKL